MSWFTLDLERALPSSVLLQNYCFFLVIKTPERGTCVFYQAAAYCSTY